MKKDNIMKNFYSNRTINKINKKVMLLGTNYKYTAIDLLNVRLLTSLLLLGVLLYLTNFEYIIISLGITAIYFLFFFKIFIDTKINARSKKLEKESLYFFEVLALSLEAGRNIKTAIEVTTLNIDSELSSEFKKVLKDMNFGKSLNDALNDLRKRIPSDNINNIILNIKDTNIFGNNIISALYNQIEYIRERKLLEEKARISKMPVKISVVSILFFIPLLLAMLLGPMLIQLLS